MLCNFRQRRFELVSAGFLPVRGGESAISCFGTDGGVSQADWFRQRGRPGVPFTEGEPDMSERIETLKKARERMADDRDAFAKTLAAPFDRDKAERARLKFIETQVLIDAIDRAIDGERARPAPTG